MLGFRDLGGCVRGLQLRTYESGFEVHGFKDGFSSNRRQAHGGLDVLALHSTRLAVEARSISSHSTHPSAGQLLKFYTLSCTAATTCRLCLSRLWSLCGSLEEESEFNKFRCRGLGVFRLLC